jgi:MFS family permease
MTHHGQTPFRVGSLAVSVYLPNFLFAVGQGAAIPVIALLALDLGASPAGAGAIVALRGLGTMIFDIPAGVLIARIGEKRSLTVATAVLVVIAVAISIGPSLALYAVLVFLMGCAWSVWLLARLAFATDSSPLRYRGRVMSMVGGMGRMGHFVGPLIGGLVVIPAGLSGPFMVQALLVVAASFTLSLTATVDAAQEVKGSGTITIRELVRDHRRTLLTAGLVMVVVQVLRSSRQALIPLWGDQIGIGPSQISLIFGASSAVESLLFYPVGILMDRKGRKWAATPSILLLSVGIASIPLTSDAMTLTFVALLIGLANGLGTGINMILGSDLSPSVSRNQFFGVWRLVSDVGTAGGPLLVAGTAGLASLGVAAMVVGAVGIAGLALLWLKVPETLTETG